MKTTLISFALLLTTTGSAIAGPSNLPTNVPQEDPARRRTAPHPMALLGMQPHRELQRITVGAGNAGQQVVLFRSVTR